MNQHEAPAVLALLRHLDGSQIIEPDDLIKDVTYLDRQARRSSIGAHPPLDEDTIFEVLGEVAQRHADAGL